MIEGMLVLFAGVVLVTPGILTDLLGFSLLVPTVRGWVAQRLSKSFEVRVAGQRGETAPDPFVDVVATQSREADPCGKFENGESGEAL
jgi:UPF0716 protein FxsA